MNEATEAFTSPNRDAQWWLAEQDEKHDRMQSVLRDIRSHQSERKVGDLINAALYTGSRVTGFGIGGGMRLPVAMSNRPTLNVVRNMVGAVTSKIASKNKPKPRFLTDGEDYALKEQAEKLEKFVAGVFDESGVYAQLAACFRDCCVWGTGCLKVYESDDKSRVEVERIAITEIAVDDGEGRYGQPRNLYQRRYYDRLVLLAKWAAEGDDSPRALAIRVALASPQTASTEDAEFYYRTSADEVLVSEGWHLGEKRGAMGRHVVSVDGATLLDEEWDGPFPFIFLQWTKPLDGFFGVGLAEELQGIQREINKLLTQIQRGHHLIAGHWLVENGSNVLSAQLNNDLAAIVKYSGTRPTYEAPQIIAPEVYAHLWQLYAKAFEIAGISQLQATGMKPSGLDSGEAQRVYNDIQTERFLEVAQAYEEFVVETARQVVRCAKRVGGDYRVGAIGKGSVNFISWSEIDIEETLYRIHVYPTSMLPSTPAGKLAWAQDMIKSEVLPSEDVLEVIDFPDTQAYATRRLAPRRIIERNVSHMIKTGKFVSPEPFDNHVLALRLVNESYHEARLNGVPEPKLELLRRYMADTADMLPKPQPMGPAPAPVAQTFPDPFPPPVIGGPPMQPPMPIAA